MLTLSVSDVLLGTRYRSFNRHFEGEVVQVEKVDYEDTYKICVYTDSKDYRWATISVYSA